MQLLLQNTRLMSLIYRELQQLTKKKINNPMERWVRDIYRKGNIISPKHMKIYSPSLIIKEIKSKTILKY